AFGGVVARDRNRHVGGGLAREHDLERGRAAGFRGAKARVGREAGRGGVVVGVGGRDVGRVNSVVDRVGAGRGAEHDGVGNAAVLDGVVDAGDRDALRLVPGGGGEREAGRRRNAFGGVVARDRNRHVGGGLAREHDLERRRAAGFSGPKP